MGRGGREMHLSGDEVTCSWSSPGPQLVARRIQQNLESGLEFGRSIKKRKID